MSVYIYIYIYIAFNLSGKITGKISEFVLTGLGINGGIRNLSFSQTQFSEACGKHLQLALKLTKSIVTLERNLYYLKDLVNFGMGEHSSMMIFHGLKENQSIKTLIMKDCDFSGQGFDMLNECLGVNETLTHMELKDLRFLGSTTVLNIIYILF